MIVTLLCAPLCATAQEIGVREILFDTMSTGDVQPVPIGVDQMVYVGNEYITGGDSTLMEYVTRIVQRDLDFYADFELIMVDSFFVKLYEIVELNLFGWQRLGADHVVRLEAEFPGRMMRVRWKLWDANIKRQFARGTVDRKKDDWRNLGHEIANEIVTQLTGDPGIFLTRIRRVGAIVYIAANAVTVFVVVRIIRAWIAGVAQTVFIEILLAWIEVLGTIVVNIQNSIGICIGEVGLKPERVIEKGQPVTSFHGMVIGVICPDEPLVGSDVFKGS